jgi:hypothetical protein
MGGGGDDLLKGGLGGLRAAPPAPFSGGSATCSSNSSSTARAKGGSWVGKGPTSDCARQQPGRRSDQCADVAKGLSRDELLMD